MPRTPKQERAAIARKLEAMATPANPKVKPGDVTLSAADARLIAAFPELLGALKEQVAECFDDDPCEMCARHMALIARIEACTPMGGY